MLVLSKLGKFNIEELLVEVMRVHATCDRLGIWGPDTVDVVDLKYEDLSVNWNDRTPPRS